MKRRTKSNWSFRVHVDGFECVYCGDPADTRDHFPPASACLCGWALPACHECNAIAQTKHPFTIDARLEFVKSKLRRKYRRYLKITVWSDEEMDEVGQTIKTIVTCQNDIIAWVRKRLSWDGLAYLASKDADLVDDMLRAKPDPLDAFHDSRDGLDAPFVEDSLDDVFPVGG